ncbi:hypothetical protein JOB18_040361 [Solea senegalensis]|uniref:Uncharacterized protein n=1 Tax=Solea senegalensis TaxID=28829 RepID=A0AAV6QHQ7_SOLSE|nr:hypothetical protein JOB18_040361 [Solea senegalensis]
MSDSIKKMCFPSRQHKDAGDADEKSIKVRLKCAKTVFHAAAADDDVVYGLVWCEKCGYFMSDRCLFCFRL